jgi:hypothetical protein
VAHKPKMGWRKDDLGWIERLPVHRHFPFRMDHSRNGHAGLARTQVFAKARRRPTRAEMVSFLRGCLKDLERGWVQRTSRSIVRPEQALRLVCDTAALLFETGSYGLVSRKNCLSPEVGTVTRC